MGLKEFFRFEMKPDPEPLVKGMDAIERAAKIYGQPNVVDVVPAIEERRNPDRAAFEDGK